MVSPTYPGEPQSCGYSGMETVDLGKGAFYRRKDARRRFSELSVRSTMITRNSQFSVRFSYGMGLSPICPREHVGSSSRQGGACVYNEED